MKIVGRILISLAGAVALVAGAVAGCSTTNNLNSGGGTSDIGETCTRTFDCKSGLVCEQNVCLKAAPTAPDGGVLPPGDSGTTPGPHLGLLNESCQTSADCQSPFECMNQSCSVVSYGLTATGKACAECKTAADCCELPVEASPTQLGYLEPWSAPAVDGGIPIEHGANGVTGEFATYLLLANARCQDVLAFIGGDTSVCTGAATFDPGRQTLASACFIYNTYCGSCAAAPPWTCTPAGLCSYTAPCTASGTVAAENANACPAASRLHSGFSTTCTSPDGGTGGNCTAGCAVDSDCAGKTPTNGNHACASGDAGGSNCTCYQTACYLSCTSDLDCAAGQACDTAGTHLCKTETCTTDAECVESLRNPQGKCAAGACTVACTKDTDCNPPTSICSAGACVTAGCTSDLDCNTSAAHAFCVTAPTSTTTYSNAVTN
jgi:hypothetical protein